MEEYDILIKIEDSHEMDGDTDGAEITTVGTLKGDENDYTIKYKESGELEGCEVSLNVRDKDTVTMTRKGVAYQTQLIMQKGKRHNCYYMTPAGELMIGVFASEVNSDVDVDGGELSFRYTLDFNAGLVSENELKITVSRL